MKKTSRRLAVMLVLGLAFILVPGVHAKGSKGGKGKPKAPDPVVHDTVSLVDDKSITVMGKKESKTYAITRFTEIIVNGQQTGAKGIEIGMLVSVGADSSGAATLINAHTAPQTPKTGKKGK